MSEYISRETVLEILRGKGAAWDAYSQVQSIPAADVRPVVRGHIEEDENTYLFCSECNCNITLATYETPNSNLFLLPNYCPNCGADMREV